MISRRAAHPALVSEQDFVAAQAINATPLPDTDETRTYLLVGLLRCGICDRLLDSHWVYRSPGYRCRHGHTSAHRSEPERRGLVTEGFPGRGVRPHQGAVRRRRRAGILARPAPHGPVPGITMAGPLDVTADVIQPQLEYYLYGGIASAQQILDQSALLQVLDQRRAGEVGDRVRQAVETIHQALAALTAAIGARCVL